MTYDQLVDFIHNRMRMSHVYQPVMLAALLAHGGKCSTEEIARAVVPNPHALATTVGYLYLYPCGTSV
jgi:hypothetical protein